VPLHDGDFVRFAQNELGLPPLAGHFGAVRALEAPADDGAYALRRWREELGRVPPATATVFGFFLRFDPPWGEVNAAIAVVDWDAQAPLVAGWRAQDLYVPPGLWGIGLGETFLGRLLAHLAAAGCRLVQVEAPPPSQGGAHLHPLYSGAHFLRRTVEGTGGEPRTWFERRLP
jgi:GNAT superfamily N-acetyltransferase